MTSGVINDLEVIQVNIEQGATAVVSGHQLYDVIQLVFKVVAVIQPRQGIMLGQVFHLSLGQAIIGHISKHQHHAMHHPPAVTNRGRGIFDDILFTIL